MNTTEAMKKMRELVDTLNKASDAYYNGQQERMSDYEWDAAFDALKKLEEETGTVFNDQSHIVYVNSQIKDETALGKLMHDFFCTDAKDMFYSVLANRVQYFKQDAKGVATMCRAMEEMRNETVRERNIEIAKTMLASKKLSYEDIALFSGLTVDEVKSLDAKRPA